MKVLPRGRYHEQQASKQSAFAVGLLLECQASGEWPGPPAPDQPRMIGVPRQPSTWTAAFNAAEGLIAAAATNEAVPL